jgi:CyaY protein
MTDPEFMDHAERLLKAIEVQSDRINDETDTDLDTQRVGGMLTLTFSNQSQIVVNLQKPLHEIWLAAKSGGSHYRWIEGQWRDTKGQGEFFAVLTHNATLQSGLNLLFS